MEAEKPPGVNAPFELGDLKVDPTRNRVAGPSGKSTLEPKVMAVLVRLAEQAGDVVTRRAIVDDVWAREYGGDESLTRAVSLLRKTLAASGSQRVSIETVPRRGYRVVVRPAARGRQGRPVGPLRAGLAGALFVLLAVLAWRWGADSSTGGAPLGETETVVAVLPFDSFTPLEDDRYLAEGLADELISQLTRTRDLAVIAGNSSFRFRGEDKKDLERLVDELGVTHVVDGSVRRSEDGLRVGVHLVDARNGLVTWSNVLRKPEAKAYTIPPLVAGEVLAALGRSETPARQNDLLPDQRAYQLMLQARAQIRADPRQLEQIIPLLEAAVRREPQLAEAWAHLAIARLNIIMVRPGALHTGYRNRDPEERLSKVRSEAHRALTLDAGSPEARLALAVVDYRARLLPLDEAERRFRSVLDRTPNHSNVNQRLGMMLLELGRYREAVHYLRRAHELDPLSEKPASLYLQFLMQIGERDIAGRMLATGRYGWWQTSYTELEWFLTDGDYESARAWLASANERGYLWAHGSSPQPMPGFDRADRLLALLGRLVAVAESGHPESDPGLPDELIRLADDGVLLHSYVAILLGAAGYVDPVFDLVMQRLAVDDLYMRGFLFREVFREIRADPRVMAWFDAGTQLDYWLQTGQWADFCAEKTLPYDCREAALAYRAAEL